ncbi:MAG: DUF2156 domain-containing protein [Proteobacteria bacterium]|nr:DUF2156 domain-containing protein [Pseudomonadota bacterium]MBU1389847.1 DUF2156 domain-containing protein [Pseudomonadota bacterium]MBU1543856.1 DUF2156 domain-containing protein [Pseudomonadota bacterium]MBU2430870.1 DUF2156 domain-containing protein [Pseudomonadota bacterium]MBU2481107.1 DUF2156 domain-containing protein [Pseudomonadota bacterium]
MYIPEQISAHADIQFPAFKSFSLEDRSVIESFTDDFQPMSCEYNFANLFTWQNAYDLAWTIYQGRLLIYHTESNYSFMPIGEEFTPEELAILSLNLKKNGKSSDFALVTPEYIEKFPDLKKYYRMRKNRNHAEYIYDVESLCELSGPKLHKKRNLISQFKRLYPDFRLHVLTGEFKQQALEFSRDLKNSHEKVSQTLELEFEAIKISFEHFESLGLEGLAITHNDKMIAFSVFSRLGDQYFDIHFEKSDMAYKGAAQVINQETALYLKNRCKYLNREQDLGIKGLRQAKMSYEPVKLITPVKLFFAPLN